MKPRAIWIITALCLALLGGAMAWITRSMLRMEADQNRMANDGAVQEMARLSLWRMEGVASALVITESARPAEHYRTFSTPETLLNNGTFSNVNAGDWVAPSPLLTQPSEYCKLYFEMDVQGTLRSPQVPVGKDLAACVATNMVPPTVVRWNADNLSALRTCIDSNTGTANGTKIREMQEQLRVPATLTGNRAFLWSMNDPARESVSLPAPAPPAPPPQESNATPAPPSSARDKSEASASRAAQTPAYAQQQQTVRLDKAQQQELNTEEAKARQEVVQSGKNVNRRVNNYENGSAKQLKQDLFNKDMPKDAAPVDENTADQKKGEAITIPFNLNAILPQAAPAPVTRAAQNAAPQVVTKQSPLLPEAAIVREQPAVPSLSSAPPATSPPVRGASAAPTTATAPAPAAAANSAPEISDFRPIWLGDALLLTRRVTTPDRQWIQGAWLDWEKLRTELLDSVKDRFPAASVVRAPENPEPGAHLLASLPVQLVPGTVTFPAAPFWSPLKVSLSIAWLCVLLAVAAVALVLRGMMSLSERRASFVSSVTHELRTPLATFKIYSEMLADGMVKEETKKQQYLETLTGEADRLGHLVENVLAYSRIERGKGPTAAASVRTGDLVARIEPRLNQRTLLAGMDFGVTSAPDALDIPLRTDAGAVEQILCNLVDNACKYGRRDGAPGKVELVISRERRRLCLTVRDCGPGIPKGEQNTIFLPFHKSARDAAHSAPGVGLGLALCRRLACELRGTLEMDRSWKQGASFVLRLPV